MPEPDLQSLTFVLCTLTPLMLLLASSRLSVLTKYHKLYAIKMCTLRALLQKIKEHKLFLPKTLSPEDLRRTGDKSVEWVREIYRVS